MHFSIPKFIRNQLHLQHVCETVQHWSSDEAKQYGLVLAVIGVVVSVGFIFSDSISYRMVAFGLLLAVTLMALFFDIRLIFVAALLSALLWGYLFIPPRFDFTIVLPQTGCCSLPILWWHSTTSILS